MAHEFKSDRSLASARDDSDGVCMEIKPKGLHERRKATLRYTVSRGWERKGKNGWEPVT